MFNLYDTSALAHLDLVRVRNGDTSAGARSGRRSPT